MTIDVYAARTNSWSEKVINKYRSPRKGKRVTSISTNIKDGDKVRFDVSSLINKPAVYTLILKSRGGKRDVEFGSSESQIAPELKINFDHDGTTPLSF